MVAVSQTWKLWKVSQTQWWCWMMGGSYLVHVRREKNAIGSSWILAFPKCSYYTIELAGESILKGSYYTLHTNLISPKKGVRSTLQDQIQN